jgi:hypothetical protein
MRAAAGVADGSERVLLKKVAGSFNTKHGTTGRALTRLFASKRAPGPALSGVAALCRTEPLKRLSPSGDDPSRFLLSAEALHASV